MQLPLQITYRDVEATEAIEAEVRAEAANLERFYGRLTSCRVVVEAPHRRHRKGKIYHVRVDLTVPGAEVVVDRDPAAGHEHEDLHLAIRDAFRAARRRLEDHARRAGGRVKWHEPPPHGRVARLFADQGYGFIVTADGQEIYFHQDSVTTGGFAELRPGAEVRYALHEGEGEKGPQASAVTPVGKHHPPDVETR